MRTYDERIQVMHERAQTLRRRRENLRTAALGCAGLALFAVLAGIIGADAAARGSLFPEEYAGAALSQSGAGGYVLTAVLAFMAGTVITALCIRWKNGKK